MFYGSLSLGYNFIDFLYPALMYTDARSSYYLLNSVFVFTMISIK